jgi:hypothetical protein
VIGITGSGRAKGWQRAALLSGTLVMCGMSASACSAIGAIKKVSTAVHDISGGNKAVSAWEAQVAKGDTAKYQVSYETTGPGGSTVTYASDPPSSFALDVPGSNGSGTFDYIQNGATGYYCSQTSGKWTCIKEATSGSSNTYSSLFEIYQGSYWLGFLKYYEAAAALEGVTVKNTTMSKNGFNLSCIVIENSKAQTNGGTFCYVTSTGVLGYTHSNGSNSSFEIKSYSSSPSSSLFQLPSGATITTLPAGT